MSQDLVIQNLGSKGGEKNPLKHAFMPSPTGRGFRLIAIGSSGSGKSNAIKNMLTLDAYGYRDWFKDDIFIVSETLGRDETWDSIELPKFHKMKDYNEDTLNQIIDYSSNTERGTLLLFDDMVCSDAINKYKSTLMDKIFMLGRHSKVNAIFTSQKYNALSPKMRANATHCICFGLPTVSEKKMFLDDNSDLGEIEARYGEATREPFSFLYIDRLTKKAYRNFEQVLEYGEDDGEDVAAEGSDHGDHRDTPIIADSFHEERDEDGDAVWDAPDHTDSE